MEKKSAQVSELHNMHLAVWQKIPIPIPIMGLVAHLSPKIGKTVANQMNQLVSTYIMIVPFMILPILWCLQEIQEITMTSVNQGMTVRPSSIFRHYLVQTCSQMVVGIAMELREVIAVSQFLKIG
uniref:Uncharacterized protein n=1 Tax=Arundo donax TaxID=35708 RepID=A0A0A9F344_ARUDO